MNREKLKKIFTQAKHFPDREFNEINDATTNLQGATENQIVFYKVGATEKMETVFRQRLKTTTGCTLVLNRAVPDVDAIVIDEQFFLSTQKKMMDQLRPVKEKNLKLVGVTGTNGKTSVVDLMSQVSHQMGKLVVSVGTIGVSYSDGSESNLKLSGTTPSYIDFRKVLYEASQKKCSACIFEFSSHALAQDRIYDYQLDLAGWTNLTQDHLDYHKTMDNYFAAKLRIGKKFLKEKRKLFVPFTEENLFQRLTKENLDVEVTKSTPISRSLPLYFTAGFSKTNLDLAFSMCVELWGATEETVDFSAINLPFGRFDVIRLRDDRKVIVDYAHTPDALKQLILCAKEIFKNKKCNILFGCGGNRDQSKRNLMGKVAIKYADDVCVTSDNPRDEDPKKIINQIVEGLNVHMVEVEREKAISMMLAELNSGEVLLVAGKGHEQYQEVNGVMLDYSDYVVIEKFGCKKW